jgi:NAD(P)H dehydrogenase (quinone)
MAIAVSDGAKSIAGVSVNLFAISGTDIDQGKYTNQDVLESIEGYDAVAFGAPTYMGGAAAQFKAFADATVGIWTEQKWKDKLAAGFTVSGTPSGDKLSTLQYLQAFAMQHGMIWVGLGEPPMQSNGINRLGSWSGAMAQTEGQGISHLGEKDLSTGHKLGSRVALWVRRTRLAAEH